MIAGIYNINNLNFKYGKENILEKCFFSVNENEIAVLLGLNGSGKSTLFGCMLKQLRVEDKSIYLAGNDLNKIDVKSFSKMVSYVSQMNTIRVASKKVCDYIVEGVTPHLGILEVPQKDDYAKAYEYAKHVGVNEYYCKNLNELSGGQLQLVMIARALTQETPVIIMDEPMSALDLKNQVVILDVIKELQNPQNGVGKTIIFSTHNPKHALYLDCKTCILRDKKVKNIGIAKNVLDNEVLSDLYGEGVKII